MPPVITSCNTAFTIAHKQQGRKPLKGNEMDTLFELFYVFGLLSLMALLAFGFVRYVLGIEIE